MSANTELSANLKKQHIHENIVQLRRFLGLSQKGFIAHFLSDADKCPLISAGTYSNLEHGEGPFTLKAAALIAEQLKIDPTAFELHPDSFAKNLDLFTAQYVRDTSSAGGLGASALPKSTGYTDALVHILSDYLTEGLMSGELHPRDKLPSDRELAQKFEVSRSTIREALRVLSLIGLIETRPGQGSFVASNSSEFFLAPLSWSFLLGQKSAADMIVVRNLLESGTARLAAELATPENLAQLREVMQQMRKAHDAYDFKLFLELDMTFHLAIAQCAQNPIIYDLLRTARRLLTLISHSGMTTVAHLDSIYQEHTEVYQAILNKDGAAAAQAMQRHLDLARTRYQMF